MWDIPRRARKPLVSPGLPVRAIVRGAAVAALLVLAVWASVGVSDDFTGRIASHGEVGITRQGEEIFLRCAPREFYTPAPDCPYMSHRPSGHPCVVLWRDDATPPPQDHSASTSRASGSTSSHSATAALVASTGARRRGTASSRFPAPGGRSGRCGPSPGGRQSRRRTPRRAPAGRSRRRQRSTTLVRTSG
jgi:hypothetical protein